MDGISTIDRAAATHALVAAVTSAALAPSIHNTQPWRWRIEGGTADLYADLSRQLRIADPDRRLLTLSCGAALHHARVALAAAGVGVATTRLADPHDANHHLATVDPADPDHLARIVVTGSVVVTDAAVRLNQMTAIRHTDRRPLLDRSLPPEAIPTLRDVALGFGIGVHPLTSDQVLELATFTARSQETAAADSAARAELDAWTDPLRPAGAGIPDADIPDQATATTVPTRDFGHVGSLPVPGGHDRFATYVILHGLAEQPRSWLHAGEALSAVWLTAAEHLVTLLPLSAAVESPAGRQQMRHLLSDIGYPYLVLRLGTADETLPSAPRTPRLPVATTMEVVG